MFLYSKHTLKVVAQHQIASLVFKDNKRESILLINIKILVLLISNVVYRSRHKTKALLPFGSYILEQGSFLYM